LRRQRDETAARERELVAAYRAAVVAALVDVEKALTALQAPGPVREFERGAWLRVNAPLRQRGYGTRGARGIFLRCFSRNEAYLQRAINSPSTGWARLQGLIALCKALGGGWSIGAAPAGLTGTRPFERDAASS